jgi:hypothetical protein
VKVIGEFVTPGFGLGLITIGSEPMMTVVDSDCESPDASVAVAVGVNDPDRV